VSDERLRALALKTFAELGLGPYNRMLHALKSPQASELSSLIFVGGELGYAQGLPLAMDAVHDRDPQLRHTATRALGRLGRTTELNLLLHLLDDEVSEIQDAATDAIAHIGQRQRDGVLRTVIPLLGDNDPLKRVRFVRILGSLGGEEIEKLLLNAFMDTSSLVRCEAVRSLIGRRSEAVVSGVTLVLNDESAEVRRLAVSALAEDPQIKMLPVFKRAVEDNDLWVRAAVMRALQHFSDDEARQLLLRGVEDPVGLVAIAALESSMAVFPDECRGLLEHALEHPDEEVVKAAMQQFEMLAGLDWIFPFTEKLLNHRHWDVRISAARSLGCSGLDQASFWLENRLMIEENSLVRQALALALAAQLRTQRQAL
jgi:HEAT repeat protein